MKTRSDMVTAYLFGLVTAFNVMLAVINFESGDRWVAWINVSGVIFWFSWFLVNLSSRKDKHAPES